MPPIQIKHDSLRKDLFFLSGFIDDLTNLEEILKAPHGFVTLDLGGIEDINSYGVKIWSQFLISLKHHKIIYRNVRPGMVRQMNVVINLRKDILVESIFIPFECPSCQVEQEVLFTMDSIMEHSLTDFVEKDLSNIQCPRCAGTMESMEDEGSYLKFSNKRSS